ncbi:unnamed protein product [Paramecium sonneborni]|uniref:Calpain catalytic domain-containing protein n=1 Tax=Paramecium sonneborni TaxID=65129 RepID=A0A8S1QRX9_9CILI|nr:unnamed protein product [Paramecium sonneborni]
MQYQNRTKFEQETQIFYTVNKKKFDDGRFDQENENRNLVLYELAQLENIQKSYLQDLEIKDSSFFKSFALINAIFIVQQNMSNLKQNFEQREDRLFGVWLWQQGEQHLVIVDDQIPCIFRGNYPELATIISKYEWPIILQKAIGKFLGYGYNSFNSLKNETVDFFIQMITGSIIIEQEFQSIEELEKISRDKQVILFVKYTQNSQIIASIIEFTQIYMEGEQRLIRLIAPNQQSVFAQGRSKDYRSCYLNWQEFKQNFQTVHQLIWKDDYRVTPVQLKNPSERSFGSNENTLQNQYGFIEHTYLYKFKLDDDDNNYQITIWQKDYIINEGKIEILNNYSSQKLGLIRILLFQEFQPNQYKFIDGNCNFLSYISINQKLKKGDYFILCQGYFNQLQQRDLTLTIKGLQVPQSIIPDQQQDSKLIKLITTMIMNHTSLENTRSIQEPQIQVTTNKAYGFLYFYYKNKGTIEIYEQVNFQQLGFFIEYNSLTQQQQFQIKVQQNHFQIQLYTLDPRIIIQQENLSFKYCYTYNNLDKQQQQQQQEKQQQQADKLQLGRCIDKTTQTRDLDIILKQF